MNKLKLMKTLTFANKVAKVSQVAILVAQVLLVCSTAKALVEGINTVRKN